MIRKSSLPPRRHRLKRSAVKPRNAARKRREFARAYGSPERVAFVRSRRCIVLIYQLHAVTDMSPCDGPIEVAHHGTGGMSRKADASRTFACCQRHHRAMHDGRLYVAPDLLRSACADTERAWQTFSGGGTA